MQRFLPGRHQIETFGNGGFRLGDVSHQGSIVITPSGARVCDALDVDALQLADFAVLISEKTEIDMVIIGTGREVKPLPKALMQYLREQNIAYDTMSTNAAVRTYNVVEAENRRVAAVMIAVEKAYG